MWILIKKAKGLNDSILLALLLILCSHLCNSKKHTYYLGSFSNLWFQDDIGNIFGDIGQKVKGIFDDLVS